MSTVVTTVTTEDDKEVGEKTYRGLPGSTFIEANGNVLSFDAKGYLKTTSNLAQRELDKIANKVGSLIYTDDKNGPAHAPNEPNPAEELKSKAAAAQAAIAASQRK